MNSEHIERLSSPEWAEMLRRDLLPWVTSAAELGDDVLEVGPGPGLTTDLLRVRAKQLTAIEIDEDLAEQLRSRLAGSNVDVVTGNAAAMDFDSDRFSAVACFSVLHHIQSADEQDQVFKGIADSIDGDMLQLANQESSGGSAPRRDRGFLRHVRATLRRRRRNRDDQRWERLLANIPPAPKS